MSACVWNQGAEEHIVTINPKESSSVTSGGGASSSSSGSSKLSGGTIAGIVIACIAVAALIAAGLAYAILRKRRKWMRKGFAVAATKPEPDEAVLKGPVFNSEPRSTTDNSTPFSAADISSGPRSTAEYSRSAANSSPARPPTIGEDTTGAPTQELDGRPVAENPGVYELPGSFVAGAAGRKPDLGQHELPVGGRTSRIPSTRTPLHTEEEATNESPPSPFVSTLGTDWGNEERARTSAAPVSPTTPTHHEARHF